MKGIPTTAVIKSFLKGLLFMVFFSFSIDSFATHFRYGNISWSRDLVNPNTIHFKVTQAWRRGFDYTAYNGSNPTTAGIVPGAHINFGSFFPFNFGDGFAVTEILTVTSISMADDWFIGEFIVSHTYPNGNYLAFFEGAARISPPLLQNNGDGSFRVETRVTVGNNNDAPVSTLPPILNMVVNQASATYQVPATDPDGDPIVFSLAPPPGFTQAGFSPINSQPVGFFISPTGLISFNTVGKVVGRFYNAVIRINDDNGAYMQLDVLIKITNPSAPPFFDYTVTPANLQMFTVAPGSSVNFTIRADDPDNADFTTLFGNGIPIGATLTPGLPLSGPVNAPVQSTFNWTPTLSQVGSYVTTFIAQDPQGVQTPTTVNFTVACNTGFTTSAENADCKSLGSLTVNVTSGPPPYDYSKDGGVTYVTGVNSPTYTFNGLPAGNYNVRVRSSNGCIGAGIGLVGENPDLVPPVITCPPNVSTTNDDGQCGAVVNYPLPTVQDDCGNCSSASIPGYSYIGTFEGHKYYTSQAPLNWQQAKLAAEAAGGHLATIGSSGENDFLKANTSFVDFSFWIGGFQNPSNPGFSEPGGGWEWVDGTPWAFTAWNPGEPNQFFGPTPTEDFLQFYAGFGLWNDLNDGPIRYILEMDCTIQPQLVSGLPSGSLFPVGTTIVTYKATDAAGNNSFCNFSVTVVDHTNPTISCTSDITVNNAPGLCAAPVVIPAPVLADNCPKICNSDNLDEYNPGPVSGQSPQWVVWPGGQTALVSTEQFLSAPNSLKVTGVPAGGPVDQTFLLGNQTSGEWILSFMMYVPVGNTGYYNLQHLEAAGAQWAHQVMFNSNGSGRLNRTGVITSFTYPQGQWFEVKQLINQLTDQTQLFINGVLVGTWQFSRQYNNAVGTNSIGSFDFYPATVNFLGGDPNPGAVPLFYVDNITLCGAPVPMGNYISRRYSKQYPVGITPVKIIVSDPSGNMASCNFQVNIVDSEVPVVVCKPVTVTLVNGTASIQVSDVEASSSDNCGIQSHTLSKSTFNCSDVGTQNVILTVTDNSNNVSTCTATVTVVGEVPSCSITSIPSNNTYTGGIPTNIYLGYGPQSTTLQVSVPASGAPYTYSWTGGPLSSTSSGAPVFAPTAEGMYTFTVLVTNKYGCTTTCSITICVLDIRVPGTGGKKVYVCHYANGANPHTIEISVNAVSTHIFSPGHGDHLGTCDQSPCGNNMITLSRNVTGTIIEERNFRVQANPNPSTGYFTLNIQSSDKARISVRIMDIQGRIVYHRDGLTPNTVLQVGNELIPGTYMAEVIQGSNRYTVKLLKLKQ